MRLFKIISLEIIAYTVHMPKTVRLTMRVIKADLVVKIKGSVTTAIAMKAIKNLMESSCPIF